MIYLRQTEDRRGFASEGLRLAVDKLAKDSKRVLIKPNIVSHEPYPTTTHPEVLRTCLEYFLARNKETAVADGPALDVGDSREIIKNHPLKAVCDDLGVPLLNLAEERR